MSVVAWAGAREGEPGLEERFAGRWDPRRALHEELRPLLQAAADAHARAGWGQDPQAAIVVGVDRYGAAPAAAFQAQLRRTGSAPPRPSDFLASLPSTPAATLGLCLGLGGYQATLAGEGAVGGEALEHALDLLRLGRAPRVLVAALTSEPAAGGAAPFRLGVAACLDREAARGEPWTDTGDLLREVPAGYRGRAAPGLLALIEQRPGPEERRSR